MTQRIVIEWEPYEHSDERTVEAAQKQLGDRIVGMVKSGMRSVVQEFTVTSNDETLMHRRWGEWQ